MDKYYLQLLSQYWGNSRLKGFTKPVDPHMQKQWVNGWSAKKRRKMWCGCGKSHPRTRDERPNPTPRTTMTWTFFRADDGIRTRDPHLGKVMLYQLSHVRVSATP
jgi:hypothetical protein